MNGGWDVLFILLFGKEHISRDTILLTSGVLAGGLSLVCNKREDTGQETTRWPALAGILDDFEGPVLRPSHAADKNSPGSDKRLVDTANASPDEVDSHTIKLPGFPKVPCEISRPLIDAGLGEFEECCSPLERKRGELDCPFLEG